MFVVVEVEVGEEAEGSEGEREDGRDDLLEEPGGEEDGSVAAELREDRKETTRREGRVKTRRREVWAAAQEG